VIQHPSKGRELNVALVDHIDTSDRVAFPAIDALIRRVSQDPAVEQAKCRFKCSNPTHYRVVFVRHRLTCEAIFDADVALEQLQKVGAMGSMDHQLAHEPVPEGVQLRIRPEALLDLVPVRVSVMSRMRESIAACIKS